LVWHIGCCPAFSCYHFIFSSGSLAPRRSDNFQTRSSGTSPLAAHVSKGNGTENSVSLTQVAEQRLPSAGNKLLKFQLIDEHARESGGNGGITFSSCTGRELAPSGGYTRVFLSWRGFSPCSRTLEILYPSVKIPEPTCAPHPCICSRFAWAVHPTMSPFGICRFYQHGLRLCCVAARAHPKYPRRRSRRSLTSQWLGEVSQ